MVVDRAHTEEVETQHHQATPTVEEEDQEIPGGEILLPRWRQRVIDGKIWNVWHNTEQGGGLSSVAYASPRCNRIKQVSTRPSRIMSLFNKQYLIKYILLLKYTQPCGIGHQFIQHYQYMKPSFYKLQHRKSNDGLYKHN